MCFLSSQWKYADLSLPEDLAHCFKGASLQPDEMCHVLQFFPVLRPTLTNREKQSDALHTSNVVKSSPSDSCNPSISADLR